MFLDELLPPGTLRNFVEAHPLVYEIVNPLERKWGIRRATAATAGSAAGAAGAAAAGHVERSWWRWPQQPAAAAPSSAAAGAPQPGATVGAAAPSAAGARAAAPQPQAPEPQYERAD